MNIFTLPLLVALVRAQVPAGFKFISPADASVSTQGRVKRVGQTIQLDWHSAGVGVTVTGATALYVLLNQTASPNRFNVYFTPGPGQPPVRVQTIETTPLSQEYLAVAELDPSASVFVNIVKITEANYNAGTTNWSEVVTFTGFATDGAPAASAAPHYARRLAFIGDSVTAGFGDQIVGPCNHFRGNEDWSISWSALVCANFSAACHVTAWSGKGLYVNNENGYWAERMPTIYQRTLGSVPVMDWDWASYVPDGVTILLGGNDYSTPFSNQPGFDANYTAAYVHLMKDILSHYAPAQPVIFAMIGAQPAEAKSINATIAAVAQGRAAGINVQYLEMAGLFTSSDDWGCLGHPSPKGHALMAAAAVPPMAAALGW